MNKEMMELARQATIEGWDAFKIMAEFCNLQKEIDARIAETAGNSDIANLIRLQ